MSDSKQLFLQSSHYLWAQIVTMLAGFISFPVLTRILDKSEYGKMTLVLTLISFGLCFAKGGFNHSIVRLYNETNDGNRKVFYATNIIGGLGISITFLLLFTVLYLFLHDSFMRGISPVLFTFAGGLIILGAATSIVKNFMRVRQEAFCFNVISTISKYANLFAGLTLLYVINKDVTWLFLGYVLTDLVICLSIIKSYLPLISASNFSKSLLISSLVYGLPMLMYELFAVILELGDRFLVNYYLGTESLAVYSVGYNLSRLGLTFLSVPLTMAIAPLYMKIWKMEGRESVESFLSKAIKYYMIFGIPIVFSFILLGKELITFFASEKYIESVIVVKYVIIGEFLFGAHSLIGAGLLLSNKTGMLAIINMVSLIFNIITNVILIPIYGIKGAAIATGVSYAFMVLMIYFYSKKDVYVKINWFQAVFYIIIGLFLYMLFSNFSFSNRLLDIISRGGLYCISFLVIVILFDSSLRVQTKKIMFEMYNSKFIVRKK